LGHVCFGDVRGDVGYKEGVAGGVAAAGGELLLLLLLLLLLRLVVGSSSAVSSGRLERLPIGLRVRC